MPLRAHEMVYVFYEKLPLYDLSSHTHKFIKEKKSEHATLYGSVKVNNIDGNEREARYDPPLPVSVVKEEKTQISKPHDKDLYGAMKGGTIGNVHGTNYDPPLPLSVVKEDVYDAKGRFKNGKLTKHPRHLQKGDDPIYDPPLPVSVVKESESKTIYGTMTIPHHMADDGIDRSRYDPPLPTTTLEIKSTRGKHSTEKPIELMKWILKYYSKEGDVVLDPTMGSGSTGVSCKEMNRNFIGIEKDPEIYEVAVNRIEG